MNEKIYKVTLLSEYGDKLCELKAKEIEPDYNYNSTTIIVNGKTVENKEFHIITSKHTVVIEEI